MAQNSSTTVTELHAEDVSIMDGLDPHFSFDAYLTALRNGLPYGLAGLASWVESQYAGIELGYRADDDVASLIWVNLPSRVNSGLEMIRGPRWAMDAYGAGRYYNHPTRRAIREAVAEAI